jgi:hypothetical protein
VVTPFQLIFNDIMSSSFRIKRFLVAVDEVSVDEKTWDPPVDAQRFLVCNSALPPGEYVLRLYLELKGHGRLHYEDLEYYRFEIRSTHEFTVTEKPFRLVVVARERGGPELPLEQRPDVGYVELFRERETQE